MNKDLNIVMMGSTGTGKTCYMLAMYAAMSASLRGFTFSTQDLDDDLELTDKWEDLLKGNWPASTENSKDWKFDCNYGFRKIMGFNWHDYRGGVLRDRSDSDKEDVSKFREKVKNASCIILCVAGDQLAAYVDGGSEPKGIKQFNAQMSAFYRERQVTVPVVIAITKADQCKYDKMREGVDQLREKLLSSLFVSGLDWLVMFCPVSLGALDRPDQAQCAGLINPENVHIPVTFAIYCQLEEDIREKERVRNALEVDLTNKQREVSRLEGSWSSIFKKGKIRSERERIEAIRKNSQLTEREAEEFRRNLKRIQQDLMGDKIFIYHNGRRAELQLD